MKSTTPPDIADNAGPRPADRAPWTAGWEQHRIDGAVDASEGVEWLISSAPVDYRLAVNAMEARVAEIRAGTEREAVWLLEHDPVYTAGTSARPEELLDPAGVPVVATGRGGRYTFHGPGQRIAYVMLDLRQRGADVRLFVRGLEDWIIASLAAFGVHGERRDGRVGIWVVLNDGREAKIAAIGVRIRRWVTYHGIAVNVSPDLRRFAGIVPCGVVGHGVTSLRDVGIDIELPQLDRVLRATFPWHGAANPGASSCLSLGSGNGPR